MKTLLEDIHRVLASLARTTGYMRYVEDDLRQIEAQIAAMPNDPGITCPCCQSEKITHNGTTRSLLYNCDDCNCDWYENRRKR